MTDELGDLVDDVLTIVDDEQHRRAREFGEQVSFRRTLGQDRSGDAVDECRHHGATVGHLRQIDEEGASGESRS